MYVGLEPSARTLREVLRTICRRLRSQNVIFADASKLLRVPSQTLRSCCEDFANASKLFRGLRNRFEPSRSFRKRFEVISKPSKTLRRPRTFVSRLYPPLYQSLGAAADSPRRGFDKAAARARTIKKIYGEGATDRPLPKSLWIGPAFRSDFVVSFHCPPERNSTTFRREDVTAMLKRRPCDSDTGHPPSARREINFKIPENKNTSRKLKNRMVGTKQINVKVQINPPKISVCSFPCP